MRDDSAEILFQSFLQKVLVSSSGLGKDVHSLMLPTIQGTRKVGFGEAVMAREMLSQTMQ